MATDLETQTWPSLCPSSATCSPTPSSHVQDRGPWQHALFSGALPALPPRFWLAVHPVTQPASVSSVRWTRSRGVRVELCVGAWGGVWQRGLSCFDPSGPLSHGEGPRGSLWALLVSPTLALTARGQGGLHRPRAGSSGARGGKGVSEAAGRKALTLGLAQPSPVSLFAFIPRDRSHRSPPLRAALQPVLGAYYRQSWIH